MSSRAPSLNEAGPSGCSLHAAAPERARAARRAQRVARPRCWWWPAALSTLLCLAAAPAQAEQPASAQASSAQASSRQPSSTQLSSTQLSSTQLSSTQASSAQQPVDVEACLASHLSGQELRQSSKLLESREQFRQCARQECPAAIARDCVEWLGQYERQIPSISVRVMADGTGRTDARVSVDGVVVDNLNGKAIELNPGEHLVRVELAPFAPFETPLLISEGDQFRVVEATFTTPVAPSVLRPEPKREEPVIMERPMPTMSYVFGAVALAAAANGAGWALSSWSLRQELEKACAPACRPESVDVLKQRAIIADVSWGVSVASLLASVTFYALRPEVPVEPKQQIGFGLDVLPGGAVGSVSVSAF